MTNVTTYNRNKTFPEATIFKMVESCPIPPCYDVTFWRPILCCERPWYQ